MSVKKVGSGSSSSFNYILFIDLIVAVCIVIVAGRPDGLAITVSAAIVAVCALAYRCTVGVQSYVARKKGDKARAAALVRRQERDEAARRARAEAQAAASAQTQRRRKAWFDDD